MRDYSIDLLRFVAATFVVLLHTSAAYMYNVNDSEWIYVNIINGFTRWTVPVFVMISGSFILSKQIEINYLFCNKISRLLFVLFFWNFIYFIFNKHSFQSSIRDFIYPSFYHLWFLYMLISLYILSPILYWIVKSNIEKYFLTLWIIFNVLGNSISYWYSLDSINSIFNIINIKYMGYFILGYFLYRRFNNQNINYLWIYVGGIIIICISIILTYKYSVNKTILETAFYDNLSLWVLIPAVTIFLFFKRLKVNKKYFHLIKTLSNNSLGVYLLHPMIIRVCIRYINLFDNKIFTIILVCILSVFISVIISIVLRKIPLLKYTIK